MQALEVLHLNPVDLFFLGNLLKPMGKPGNTCGHLKIFWSILGWRPLKTILGQWQPAGPRAIKWLKYTRFSIFWNVCIAGGVPMTTLARSINSIFPKWCAFRLPNPPKIHFSMKGIPQKKIDIPGGPGKTKPVKCIKPPPKIKDPGGVGYPDPWILHLTYTHRSNNVFRGGPGEPNSWRTVNVFFFAWPLPP